MKQTAVKWLVEKLNQCEPMYSGIQSNEHKEYIDMLIEQAKEMEKEKLEQFYNHGQWAVIENGHGECFEDYYNRTFKSE